MRGVGRLAAIADVRLVASIDANEELLELIVLKNRGVPLLNEPRLIMDPSVDGVAIRLLLLLQLKFQTIPLGKKIRSGCDQGSIGLIFVVGLAIPRICNVDVATSRQVHHAFPSCREKH